VCCLDVEIDTGTSNYLASSAEITNLKWRLNWSKGQYSGVCAEMILVCQNNRIHVLGIQANLEDDVVLQLPGARAAELVASLIT